MKILLTGGTGLLGSEIYSQIKKQGNEVELLDRNLLQSGLAFKDIVERLTLLNSDLLIHCAANTDVEYCELEANICYRDNTLLTDILANACRCIGLKMVFISSTGIYGNYKDNPYIEYDKIQPTTNHHRAKWQAEKVVQSQLNDYLIIRTGWLFGGDWELKKNFVANRIRECISSDGKIFSDPFQCGNPTYVKDVVFAIFQLINSGFSGTFNCVNEGVATRFEYVREIVNCTGLDIEVIASESSFKRHAKVSHNESAINFKLNQLGFSPLPNWKLSLASYINELKGNW